MRQHDWAQFEKLFCELTIDVFGGHVLFSGMVSDVYVPVQHCVAAVVAGITEVVNGVVVGITEVIDVVMFDTWFRFVKGMHSSIQVKVKFAAWAAVIAVEIIG